MNQRGGREGETDIKEAEFIRRCQKAEESGDILWGGYRSQNTQAVYERHKKAGINIVK